MWTPRSEHIVNALKAADLYENTLIIITAKHGESPIDPASLRGKRLNTPATLLGSAIPFSESPLNTTGIGATEDDVSVLWLAPGASVTAAVALLEKNAAAIGLGQIFYGPTLAMNYNVGGLALGPGSAVSRHYRDAEHRHDVLRQHHHDRRSRRIRS